MVLLVGISGGCQVAQDHAEADHSADDRSADDPSPDLSPSPTSTPSHDPRECTRTQMAAIDEVIGKQLAAFEAGDFAEALQYATPGFRQGFSPDSFESMITAEFPVPATALEHQMVSCTVVDRLAVTTVEVTGRAGRQSLEYGLQLIRGTGWRIGGALPLTDPVDDGPVI